MDLKPPSLPKFQPATAEAFTALKKEVTRFEKSLPGNQEIGISVNGADNVIHVSSIRASNQMVVFEGGDDLGRRAQLIQHFTQVNVQLVAVDALSETATRIGF